MIRTSLNHPVVAIRESARYILQLTGLPGGRQAQAIMVQAQHIARNDSLASEKRAEAVHLLALYNPGQYVEFLENLIRPVEPLDVQLAALKVLSIIPDTTVSSFALNQWTSLSPEIRDAALNTFIDEPFNVQRIRLLLNAIEKGNIQKGALGWSRTVILMRDIPDTLKELARTLLTNNDEDRKSVIKEFEAALRLEGDPVRGKVVYQGNCIVCHQVRGQIGLCIWP